METSEQDALLGMIYILLMLANFHFAVRGIIEDKVWKTVFSGGVTALMAWGALVRLGVIS